VAYDRPVREAIDRLTEETLMEITPATRRKTRTGPPDWFTGDVTITEIALPPAPACAQALEIGFAPGARTAWHTHPLGQILHVISGRGRAQREGGRVEEIGPGDAVWFAPGENHWHGAAADAPLVHVAIQEEGPDGAADWGSHVTDAEYGS
jgi:quercetin dioxygenase-like cupin family protein